MTTKTPRNPDPISEDTCPHCGCTDYRAYGCARQGWGHVLTQYYTCTFCKRRFARRIDTTCTAAPPLSTR